MSYSSVEYVENGCKSMATVPSAWFDSFEKCMYWPPTYDTSKLKKLMANHSLPTDKWWRYPEAKCLWNGNISILSIQLRLSVKRAYAIIKQS